MANVNDAAFRRQFDPENPEYHNSGDRRSVDVGGQRVPEGMEAHANWRELPEQSVAAPAATDFGPEYARIKAEREACDKLKKSLNQVMVRMASALQALDNAKLVANRDAALAGLREVAAEFKGSHEESKQLEIVMGLIDAGVTAENFQTLQDATKKVTQGLFGHMRKQLAAMKDAKKAHLAAQKAAAAV